MKPFLLLFSLSFLLISCGVNSKSYYTLKPDGPAPSGGGMAVGVGPVMVAEYIDRPNLVVAESEHELSVAESHRWAGDLPSAIARVTAANLGRRWGTGNVRTYPWRDEDGLRRQVVIDVRQFHSGSDGYALLEAGWRVYSLPDRRLAASRTFTGREVLKADGYAEMVAAQSRLLSRLADEIAGAK